MYLTPHQKKQLRTIVILALGIPLTVFAIYKGVQYLSNAGVEATPKEVVISNLTTNSITISWVTDKESNGTLVPVLNGKEQSPVTDKRGSGKRFTHNVEIKSLEPDTKYSFQIVSDNNKYTNSSGKNFEFTTAAVSSSTPIPNPIHGSVSGFTKDDVVIYAMLKNKSAYPVSTVIPSGGNWIMDLSSFRKISDKSLLVVTNDTELILVARSNSGKGVSVEGAYSELFDSNGKLKDLYSLDIEDSADLISFFPEESILGVKPVVQGSNEEEGEDPPVVVPPKNEEKPPVDEEEYVEEDDEEVEAGEENIIVHDLVWLDMVKEGDISGFDTGEESVMITNLTDVGFTVVWRSESKEVGLIKYGDSQAELSEEAKDIRDGLSDSGKYYSHVVDVERLAPESTYYFEITSGISTLKDSGKAFSVKTLPTLGSPPPFDTKSGVIKDIENLGDWVLIAKLIDKDEVGTSGESRYVSTLPDENGSWILTIGDMRNEDGSQYFTYSDEDILSLFLLGNDSKKYEYELSENEIALSFKDISFTAAKKVKLLDNYGIILSK